MPAVSACRKSTSEKGMSFLPGPTMAERAADVIGFPAMRPSEAQMLQCDAPVLVFPAKAGPRSATGHRPPVPCQGRLRRCDSIFGHDWRLNTRRGIGDR